MKVGSLVYATHQGLGYLAKAFYEHGIVTDPFVVEHASHPTQPWYPGAPSVPVRRLSFSLRQLTDFCSSVDLMLFFETPFLWELIPFCRSKLIPTVVVPMYECYQPHRFVPEFMPDLFLCPSLLDKEVFARAPCAVEHLPVPVEVPWRQRSTVRTFVHNAGNGSFRDRNGTAKVLQSVWDWNCLKGTEDGRLIVRYQGRLPDVGPRGDLGGRIEWRHGAADYSTLWDEGDAFLFPESFNGLSLPLQEARAAGMLVIATDRFPINTWLPRGFGGGRLLLKPSTHGRARIGASYMEFVESLVDPKDITDSVNFWYGKDVSSYSSAGREWAESMSWAQLKPRYLKLLEGLL